MSETAFQATPPAPPAPAPVRPEVELPAPRPQRGVGDAAWLGLRLIASPRLTVVLFVLSLVLVFTGTMAQVDVGIWSVVSGYFRSFVAMIPLQTFVRFAQVFLRVPKEVHVGGTFPFPGGKTLAILLLANLLSAHVVRFKVTWKRSGILILHAGLIVMIVGEVVTGYMAREAKMVLAVGETVDFLDGSSVELAITDSSDPKADVVTVIPAAILSKKGTVTHSALPVELEVVEYFKNSELIRTNQQAENTWLRTTRMGELYTITDRSEEKGVDPNQREDAPSALVTVRDKNTRAVVGTYPVSLWYYSNFTQRLPEYQFPAQRFTVDGKTYSIDLRLKRTYKPYRIKLDQFHHELYPGTDVPKNFSSDLHLSDPDTGEDRDVKIFMNNPLRYSGETFYQSGFLAGDRGTILQVVHNPGWLLPYVSCFLVTVGMTLHFLLHLISFVSRRMA